MHNRTVAERVFQVKDARGRTYRITHYVFEDDTAAQGEPARWQATWDLFMSENGGYLEPLGNGRYRVDGTGTLVEAVGSGATEPALAH